MAKRWTADELLETVRGFQAACVITAAADLDLFTALGKTPMTVAAVAQRIKADPRATAVVLDALAALELLVKKGDVYEAPADVAELLVADAPTNVLAGVRHQGNCLRRWDQLARVVQTGRPARREPSIRCETGDCEAFIAAIAVATAITARSGAMPSSAAPLRLRHSILASLSAMNAASIAA